jgi:hypothetical protein
MMAAGLGVAFLCAACGSRPPQDTLQAKAREHGIEILGVQLMADGDVARLNYRVVDYALAKRSLRDDVRLLCDGTDRPLPVMSTGRLGPLRQRPTRDGRPQFMMFTNPGRALRKGDHAVLTIGGARIEGIPVS